MPFTAKTGRSKSSSCLCNNTKCFPTSIRLCNKLWWKEKKMEMKSEEKSCCVQNVLPSGSTSRANFSASEVAKSELAGDTARMRELGLEMKEKIISCTWASMSSGWSPTGTLGPQQWTASITVSTAQMTCCCGSVEIADTHSNKYYLSFGVTVFAYMKPNDEFTLVIPGKSTRVTLRTLGEKIFKYMCSELIPCRVGKKRSHEYGLKSSIKNHLWVYIMGFFSPCCHQNCVQSLFQFLYEFPENLWRSVKKVSDWCVTLIQHRQQNTGKESTHKVWNFLKNIPGSCSAGMCPILQLWRLDKRRWESVSNFTDFFSYIYRLRRNNGDFKKYKRTWIMLDG